MHRRAFTFVEMLVSLGLLLVLVSIFIPYVSKQIETNRRARCAANLKQIYDALTTYCLENNHKYPRVVYDAAGNPNAYTSFTGADDADPFAMDSRVSVNDVSASLWLLVREGKLRDTAVFICPSTSDLRDAITDETGQFVKATSRGNFRRRENLSYSYASPFGSAEGYELNDTRKGGFVLLADRNPGEYEQVSHDASPLARSKANSRNHGRAGQNVLSAGGSVEFKHSAWCGVDGDNIYTAAATQPVAEADAKPLSPGFWSPAIGPAWSSDSYLVPTAIEPIGTRLVRFVPPATQPAPIPTSAPATVPTTSVTQPGG